MQRKRSIGYRLPPGTVYVGRPTKWGNPFKEIGDNVFVTTDARWVYYGSIAQTGGAAKLFRDMLMDLRSHKVNDDVYARFRLMRDTHKDLAGKDLACFCPLSTKCHADALLELNSK